MCLSLHGINSFEKNLKFFLQCAACDFLRKFHANEAIFKLRKNRQSGVSKKQLVGLRGLAPHLNKVFSLDSFFFTFQTFAVTLCQKLKIEKSTLKKCQILKSIFNTLTASQCNAVCFKENQRLL